MPFPCGHFEWDCISALCHENGLTQMGKHFQPGPQMRREVEPCTAQLSWGALVCSTSRDEVFAMISYQALGVVSTAKLMHMAWVLAERCLRWYNKYEFRP